eukprot:Sspe_Gene.41267::Locus_19956_Transcript_1_1_Confidence_1.000_Length_2938::g.41267::m.41267
MADDAAQEMVQLGGEEVEDAYEYDPGVVGNNGYGYEGQTAEHVEEPAPQPAEEAGPSKSERRREEREAEARRREEEKMRRAEKRREKEFREQEERRRKQERRREREESGEYSCNGWLYRVSEELGFSTGFRIYVCYLLFCSVIFAVFCGYHNLMLTAIRLFVPPEGESFLVSLAMLSTFILLLIFFSTVLHMEVRLAMSWLGMTRYSVNLFYWPNYASTEEKALRIRNMYLLFFEIAVLIVPLIYAIVKTISDKESMLSCVGHFSFVGFVIFQFLLAIHYLYLWYNSIRAKRRAWKEGGRLRRAAKEVRDSQYRERRTKREVKKRRRKGSDEESDEEEEYRSRERRGKKRAEPRDAQADDEDSDEGVFVPWHHQRSKNPHTMGEFGLDLYSVRAYTFHVFLGLPFCIIMLYPLGVDSPRLEWLAIVFVILPGACFLAYYVKPSRKPKKIARVQQVVVIIMLVFGGLFVILGLIAAGMGGGVGLLLTHVILLFLSQLLLLRRHSAHVIPNGEPGALNLPQQHAHETKPLRCLPLLPCGNIWRACCDSNPCAEQYIIDEKPVHRDITRDRISRPAPMPGFMLPQAEDEWARDAEGNVLDGKLAREVLLDRQDRVLTADATITTWYLILFIIGAGFAFGYGTWSKSTLVSDDRAEAGIEAYNGSRPYATCSMVWDGGLTVQDFIFLNALGTIDRNDVYEKSLKDWFGTTFVRYPRAADIPKGDWVDLEYDHLYSQERKVHVMVMRGSFTGKRWMRDLDVWGDAVTYQILMALNPFFALWNPDVQGNFVNFLGLLKRYSKGEDIFHEVDMYVKNLTESTGVWDDQHRIVFTGHGTHGGMARLLAHELGHPVVTFSPPGIQWTAKRFGRTINPQHNDVSFLPKRAAFPLVDRHVGWTQQTECHTDNSLSDCQKLSNIACDILYSCGDPKGRAFSGLDLSDRSAPCLL